MTVGGKVILEVVLLLLGDWRGRVYWGMEYFLVVVYIM